MSLPKDRDARNAVPPGAAITFKGRPCRQCGGAVRYAAENRCVECCKRKGLSRYYKQVSLNPQAVRAQARANHGLPTPTRPEPSACELCYRTPSRSLNLDHDHITGAFRGWLCTGCNTGIGKLGDSEAGLLRALTYVRRSRS